MDVKSTPHLQEPAQGVLGFSSLYKRFIKKKTAHEIQAVSTI